LSTGGRKAEPISYPRLAAELAGLKVDVIYSAWGTPAALAAKAASNTIPIVFTGVGDAIGVGLVTSLVRPGGNVTGSTYLAEVTIEKELQLLGEAIPKLELVGVFSIQATQSTVRF
jgi:putative tryptophan/tyrosine transport system substrate-binding protein